MRKQLASFGTTGFIAAAVLLGACAGGSGTNPGTPGAAGTSAAGTTASGTAGTGAAGTTASGAAGTTASGAAGTGAAGTGAAGTTASGAAGTGAAGTTASGAAGTGAAGTGAAGTGAAGTGAAGTGAGGTGGGVKMSAGCNMPPPAADSPTAFIKHDIMVTGVSAAYISAHPLATGVAPYSFTARNYYLRLPTGYNPATPYRLVMGGTGCGGNATVGSEGGYLPSSHADQIQVSPSYVPTQGATSATNPGGCFADGSAESPDVPYFDAMLAEVSAKYCVDTSKVFVSGYSSGAWEALLLGWTRAGVVRGIATEAGGLRAGRPPGTNKPVAALMIGTNGDTENPINLTPTDAKAISLGATGGSGQARDEILARNHCTGTATAAWDATYPLCQKYTGCPAAYPVVWCLMITGGHYPAHPPYTPDAMAKFFASLPDAP
jgi:poly(3-hydroxybutyrate) depolymerase